MLEFLTKHKFKITLVAILFIALFFRLYRITEMPPGLYPDEAMNGSNALESIATGDYKLFYPENNGREGLFINIQAMSVRIFGNTPWALRSVSAIFGFLTVLALYLLSKELFYKQGNNRIINRLMDWKITAEISHSEIIALLSAFFLAVSFWHTNFSRIGFRAIMLPFLTTFSFYLLFKGFKSKKALDFIWSGIFMGLGFHTYIAFRIVPFVVVLVFLLKLINIIKFRDDQQDGQDRKGALKNFFSRTIIYVCFTIISALPLFYYFYNNPADFMGRAGQVSVFASQDPITELTKSAILTLAQFNISGDFNWRHNYAGSPLLFWPVGIFFLIGLWICIKSVIKFCRQFFQTLPHNPIPIEHIFLLSWFSAMLAPSILTTEGLPHALRSIGAIPPVFILSGLGAFTIYELLEKRLFKYSNKNLITTFYFIILLIIGIQGYQKYFISYANNPNIKGAFADNYTKIADFINNLPKDMDKYIVVNQGGTLIRGISMPAQTIMFVTDSFTTANQLEKKIYYISPENIADQNFYDKKSYVIIPMESDEKILDQIKKYSTGEINNAKYFSYIMSSK